MFVEPADRSTSTDDGNTLQGHRGEDPEAAVGAQPGGSDPQAHEVRPASRFTARVKHPMPCKLRELHTSPFSTAHGDPGQLRQGRRSDTRTTRGPLS